MKTYKEIWKDNLINDVNNLEEFNLKYRKHERYLGRGEEYANVVLQSSKETYALYGIDWIDSHASITGKVVAYQSK